MNREITEGTVRVGPMLAIPVVLDHLGFNPAQVLSQAGVNAEIFDDPDNLLSASARAHLFQVCSSASGLQHFGLLVGERGRLSSFGLIGYLAMHAASVQEALNSLARYLHLHGQGARSVVESAGNSTFFGYEIYQHLADGHDQVEDAAVTIMHNILRELCGSEWHPTEVWFTHRHPSDITPYKGLFNTPLLFNMPSAGLYFDSRWLKRSVQSADPELHRLLQKQIDELEARFVDDFPEQVRRVLHHAVLTHHASASQVAALFSIHSRSLHRRLQSFGTCFQELLDECRYSIACSMLESSDITISQLAEMLDYSDARAFSRAFKRWSGSSPSAWRHQNPTRGHAIRQD